MTMSMPSVLRPVAASAPGIRVAGASAAADFAPLVGSFECEGGPMFTLSQDACDQSGLGPATLTNLLPVEDGFIITLADGSRFGVRRKSADSFQWMSAASGDSFQCSKTD